ncbi:MAG: hypothetical protein JWO36_4968 [Myxococcales bacterium]|nr:hypothetical protein [Myxococcales bacterium]
MRWSLCLLVGCLPDTPGGVEVRGRHITVHVDPAIPICADALAVADRYVEDIADLFGVQVQPIDYYIMEGPTGCGYGKYANANCTINRTVYANTWIHFHELVHAVDDTRPPALFVEGIAEALRKRSREARAEDISRADAQLDLDSSSFRGGVPAEEYLVSGDFVRFVVERFGGRRYHSFAGSVTSLDDHLSTRIAFKRAFGVSLDSVIADWRVANPATSTATVPADLTDCHDPIAPVGPETWRVDEVVPDGCQSGMSAGGAGYEQQTGRYGFEVTDPGLFVVEVSTRGDQQGVVLSCPVNVQFDYRTSATVRRFTTMPLLAGRHAITVVDGAHAWSVSRIGAVGETCDTAPVFAAPDSEPWELDTRGSPATWIRIAYAGPRALYGWGTDAGARVCWGACGDLHCQPIGTGARVEYPAGQALYLVRGVGVGLIAVRTIGDLQDNADARPDDDHRIVGAPEARDPDL